MEPPIEKERIIKRIIDTHNYREKIIQFAEEIGINSTWVRNQHKKQTIFGPAEQLNPFITIHSYSLDETESFQGLYEEIKKEKSIELKLNKIGINSKWSFLTLKQDAFSSGGETALYHFRKINGEPVYLFSRKERRNYSHSPYSAVRISIGKILQSLEEITKDAKNQFDSESINLFSEDLHYAIKKSKKQNSLKNISYLDFCIEYNQKSLSRFRKNLIINSTFVDGEGLNSFFSEGISNWNIFLNFLSKKNIITKNSPAFLLKIISNEKEKLIRLGFSQELQKIKKFNSPNEILFSNQDFKIRGYGNKTYRLNYLKKLITDNRNKKITPLMPARGITSFLLLGGFTNFFIGDDGSPFKTITNINQTLYLKGIAPSFFGYCPKTQVLYKKTDLKNTKYIFNKSLSTISFYETLREGKE